MKTSVKLAVSALLIYFFSWAVVYGVKINKLPIQSEDTVPTMLTAAAIIQDGTLYLDKYYDMMIASYPQPDDKDQALGLTPFYLRKVGDHFISAFPLIPAFLSVPIFLIPLKLGLPVNFENLAYLSHFSAAFYVAISGYLLYLLVKNHLGKNEKTARLVTLIYLFGTINFALISQGLWQHGFVELFLIAGLLAFYNKRFFLTGVLFGLALLTRPTSAIAVGLLSILFLQQTLPAWKKFGGYLLGFAPPILFFLWYNSTYYLGIQNQGYASQVFTEWLSPFPTSFIGMWLSPSKGILIYSPVLIFAFVGFYLTRKNLKYVIFAAIIFIHTLILSLWKHWYGGWSFGYRMASDAIPFMVLLMIPYLESKLFEKTKKLFWILLIFSILVQIFGIIFFDGIWHAAYDNGFQNTAWLWSIRDSELTFNIRRILVKLGLLARACPNCL